MMGKKIESSSIHILESGFFLIIYFIYLKVWLVRYACRNIKHQPGQQTLDSLLTCITYNMSAYMSEGLRIIYLVWGFNRWKRQEDNYSVVRWAEMAFHLSIYI